MASNTFLILVVFACAVSVILSSPQVETVAKQDPPPPDRLPGAASDSEPVHPGELSADTVIDPRTFGSLFNLSAWLAGAPNNSASFNFIPLITLLSGLG